MKKGLFSKMVATYAIIIALSFVIIAAFLSFWFQGYYSEQRRVQLENEAKLIKGLVIEYRYGNLSPSKMNETLSYVGSYLNADIVIVDNYGFVNGVSNESDKRILASQILQKKDLEELRLFHNIENNGGYSTTFEKPVHTFAVPVVYERAFVGAILMNTPINEINAPLKMVYKIIWTTAIFAMIISIIVIYYFSQRIIIKPLAAINSVAGKIAKGDVGKRVDIDSDDEIGELAKSFNYMADNLEEVENNRREFISNVSHEIRSPITSIKGFIGGMLDGVIPREKQNYYLSITYEEIQRLTRLVNDLLDLSAIESGQLRLKIEKLDINEIIRLTVIKFETKIKAKRLKVDVCFGDDSLIVLGDKDRLTQVVTNLLDNAIKYANDGGNVRMCTKVKGEKVYVSVSNDGPCISNDDLTHIWDRFYKADKSRTSKVSTGLGLPIARNILTQLEQDIWVENKENEGVTFTFTLKRIV